MSAATQKILKQLFKALEQKGSKPLTRYEGNVEKLLREGFDESRQMKPYGGQSDYLWGETTGIHYAPESKDLTKLITGKNTTPDRYSPNVVAHPLPGSRSKSFTAEEWEKNSGRSITDINKELKSEYDFVTYPDINAGNKDLMQTVQLNPGRAIAKIKAKDMHTGKFDTKYKILGLGTAGMLAGQAFSPKDAEAISPNAYWKAVKPLFKEVGATRKEQAKVAQSILNLPKKDVDKVKRVEKLDSISTNRFDAGPSAQIQSDYSKGLDNVEATVRFSRDNFRGLYNKGSRGKRHIMQTPAHEVSHLTVDRGGWEGKLDVLNTGYGERNLNKVIPQVRAGSGTVVENSLGWGTPKELLAESLSTASPDIYSSETLDFLAGLRKNLGGRNFRIAKAAAPVAVGTGMMLSPEDAEAMPLGKPLKGAWKTFGEAMRSKTPLGEHMRKAGQKVPAVSKANDRLVGQPLRGSKISGVYQGIGDKRYIHLEDGRVFPTDKKSVHELAAEFGTRAYVNKFAEHAGEAVPGTPKWDQILKSLEMNETRGIPPRAGGSKPKRMDILENSLLDRQGMLQDELADQVLVQSEKSKKWWLWPRVYAEPAEAAGLVRIDRAKKTLFTNKGLRDDN